MSYRLWKTDYNYSLKVVTLKRHIYIYLKGVCVLFCGWAVDSSGFKMVIAYFYCTSLGKIMKCREK